MPSLNPLNAWRGFLALPNTTPAKALGVAFLVALVCSVLVSLTAVTLKPLSDINRLRFETANLFDVLQALGASEPEARWVKRSSGAYVARSSDADTALDPSLDSAGLGRVDDVLAVYEVRTDGNLKMVALPVKGAGYKSLLEGYVVLKGDLNTVAALTFHQQDETPGMGSKITDKDWQALWAGKQVADLEGRVRIEVVKGTSDGPYQVDGISGATRTGNGVTKLLHFWLGDHGYGPYLKRLKNGGSQ